MAETKENSIIQLYKKQMKYYGHNLMLFFKEEARDIMAFSLFCFIFSFIVSDVLGRVLSNLFSSISGIGYINQSNALEVVTNPVAIIAALIYVVVATMIALFEISGFIHAFSMAQIGLDSNLIGMMTAGWAACKKTLNPKNWLLILFLFVLMPITGVLTLSSSGLKLSLPYFLVQGIQANPSWNRMYIIAYVLLLLIELEYLFSINLYVSKDISFLQACRESRKLGRGRKINTVVTLLLLSLVLNFVINTIASSIPTNIVELISVFRRNGFTSTSKSYVIGPYVYVLRTLLKGLISPAINNAGLTVLFYAYIDEKKMFRTLSAAQFSPVEPNRALLKKIQRGIAAALVLFLIFSIYHYRYLMEPVEKPAVCAHRGDNMNAPENTLESIELALNENTPYVEVDVFEAADGTIVCMHDLNLTRLTGYDVNVTEKTFEELKNYPLLDSLPGNYENVTIPSLESVMKAVKETDAVLQIELKLGGNEKHLEEEVLRLINELDMRDRVIVISLKTNTIERIKELDPDITTAICAFGAWKEFVNIPTTDHLSVNDSVITPDLVRQIHAAGMKVLCWTVDSEDVVQYLVSCGVDVIGTNDPLTITRAVENADTKGGISRIFHIVMNQIAAMSR